MKLSQLGFSNTRIALIEQSLLISIHLTCAHRRPAITNEVFRAGQHAQRMTQIISLKTSDRGGAETLRQFRSLAEAFIRPAPSFIARDGNARGEGPVEPTRADLFRGDARGPLDQRRIACASQTNVVRKDNRVQHVVMSVHRVDAKQNRNRQTSPERLALKTVI